MTLYFPSDKTIGFLLESTDANIDRSRLLQIATTAAKDTIIAGTLVDLVEKVGKDGYITFETGTSHEDIVEIVEDLTFDRGYLSPHFKTQPDSNEILFRDCYILISPYKIYSLVDVLPILEKVVAEKKPLLVIAEDVEGEALDTLVQNAQLHVLSCVAIRTPGFGDRRLDLLEDIAVKTGGKVLSHETGLTLQNISLAELGVADKVTVARESTCIEGGHGSPDNVAARASELRERISSTVSSYDAEIYRWRLAMLTGAKGVIKVAGLTYKDVHHKKNRYINALNSLIKAVEGGIVEGGAIALLRAQANLGGAGKEIWKNEPVLMYF